MTTTEVADLVDVNVLLGAAWPSHVHHRPAVGWFRRRGGRPWATTAFTETAFVRISSNPKAIPTAVAPREALSLLDRLRRWPGHRFLEDKVQMVTGEASAFHNVSTHRQVTDAHLLAVARQQGVRLVTLDRGLLTLADDQYLEVIPAS